MKIVLSGSFSVDQIMSFDGLFEELIQPDKLSNLSVSPLVKDLRRSQGGIAGNIAYSLGLLGESPILYVSSGKESKDYVAKLEKLGVDVSKIHYSELPTATFSVLTDINDCQVGGFYPGAMADSKSLKVAAFKNEEILMVISAHDPAQMAVQVEECSDLGKRMVYDVGQQIAVLSKEDLIRGLEVAEVLMVNDYELGLLANKTGFSEKEIINKVAVCVVTNGSEGSTIYSKDKPQNPVKIIATKVEKSIDPTGAGDAFRAGFLYGYSRDWDLKKSAQLGSVVAAFSVEEFGTQEHKCSWEDIKKRYKENYGEEISK